MFKLVTLTERTTDPAEWGKNFPRQYDSYKRTVDVERTRYGGSEADPAAVGAEGVKKSFSNIERDPRLKTMWNGYAFAIDFREDRGHACFTTSARPTACSRSRRSVPACTAMPRSPWPTARRAWPPARRAPSTSRC